MKHLLLLLFISTFVLTFSSASAQGRDKSQRPSPPDSISQTIAGGAIIKINYSSPSLKGRTIGKDVEPNDGKVWRAGANEATVFETDKAVQIDGKTLPAGKYALYILKNNNDWSVIFNKVWETWGTNYEKNKDQDVLQVKAKATKGNPVAERLKYSISKEGKVALAWGEYIVSFVVK